MLYRPPAQSPLHPSSSLPSSQERLEDLHSEMGARSQVLKKQSALDERKHLLELETLEVGRGGRLGVFLVLE